MNFLSTISVPILAVTFSDLLKRFFNFSDLLHLSVLFSTLLSLLPSLAISSLLSFLPFFSSFYFSTFVHFSPLLSLLLSPLLCSVLPFFFFFKNSLTFPALRCPISTHFCPLVAACPSPHTDFRLFLPFCHSLPPSTTLSSSPLCDKTITIGQTPNSLSLLFCSPLPFSTPLHTFLHLLTCLWHQDVRSYHSFILVLILQNE